MNDYDFQPTADAHPLPSSEYSYTTVDSRSSRPKATNTAAGGTDSEIEMTSCTAYGEIAQAQWASDETYWTKYSLYM